MKDYWQDQEQKVKKVNKKKLIIAIITIIIVLFITITTLIYQNNKAVRNWIDRVIFRKEIMQDKATTI